MTKNPITTDPALLKLMRESKSINTEEQFKGSKTSFLDSYKSYLDPDGVENAKMSDARLLWSMEKLADTVVAVQDLVNDGKISADSQTVMGKRALTNMSDQIAKTEQEISRFMPATGADEEKVGYNKFELGADMIEDGFHVYELLKTTKDIITDLQDKVLNDVLPSHQQSIIQFYLRQIQTFNDVMADLGLFGLMQDIIEMYKVIPRKKKGAEPHKKAPQPRAGKPEKMEEPDLGPDIVELDPYKKYNFRTEFPNGYIDSFSGTAPGPSGDDGKNDNEEGEGEGGDSDFVIYFDMKTGVIGKIPRKDCTSKGLIVTQNDDGQEVMEGEIDDDDEKENLIWDMKKAMKNKKGGTSKAKSPGQNKKKYVITPRNDATGRTIGRSKSGDNTLKNMKVPSLDGENANERVVGRSSSGDNTLKSMKKSIPASEPLSSQTARPPFVQKQEPASSAPPKRMSGQKAGTSKRPSVQKKVPKPSNDGWSNASSMAATRRNK